MSGHHLLFLKKLRDIVIIYRNVMVCVSVCVRVCVCVCVHMCMCEFFNAPAQKSGTRASVDVAHPHLLASTKSSWCLSSCLSYWISIARMRFLFVQ
jgi:hypothetical protein